MTADTPGWFAPLCRRRNEHAEVEHNDEALAKLGRTCVCRCHGGGAVYGVDDAVRDVRASELVGLGTFEHYIENAQPVEAPADSLREVIAEALLRLDYPEADLDDDDESALNRTRADAVLAAISPLVVDRREFKRILGEQTEMVRRWKNRAASRRVKHRKARAEVQRLSALLDQAREALFTVVPWVECICDGDEDPEPCEGCVQRHKAKAALAALRSTEDRG